MAQSFLSRVGPPTEIQIPSASGLVRTCTLGVLCLVAVTGLAGCGRSPHSDKERGSVELHLNYAGAPLVGAQVNLENPQSGEGGGGVTDSQGTVSIKSVVTGMYSLVILPPEGNPLPDAQGTSTPPNPSHYPQNFRAAATTPLQVGVDRGSQEYTFDLAEADSAAK